MYVMKSVIDGNVLGFPGKRLSLHVNVRQWEFVRLFVLSNSGDVSRSALFKPHSYMLIHTYILCTLYFCAVVSSLHTFKFHPN